MTPALHTRPTLHDVPGDPPMARTIRCRAVPLSYDPEHVPVTPLSLWDQLDVRLLVAVVVGASLLCGLLVSGTLALGVSS